MAPRSVTLAYALYIEARATASDPLTISSVRVHLCPSRAKKAV